MSTPVTSCSEGWFEGSVYPRLVRCTCSWLAVVSSSRLICSSTTLRTSSVMTLFLPLPGRLAKVPSAADIVKASMNSCSLLAYLSQKITLKNLATPFLLTAIPSAARCFAIEGGRTPWPFNCRIRSCVYSLYTIFNYLTAFLFVLNCNRH